MHRFDYRRTLIAGLGFLGISIMWPILMALAWLAMQPVRPVQPAGLEAEAVA